MEVTRSLTTVGVDGEELRGGDFGLVGGPKRGLKADVIEECDTTWLTLVRVLQGRAKTPSNARGKY